MQTDYAGHTIPITDPATGAVHHVARHLGDHQPVAVPVEDHRAPDQIVNPEANEPREQQVILFNQLPL